MKPSMIIPVNNEQKFIRNVINNVFSVKFYIDCELIIVKDVNIDSTRTELNKIKLNQIKYK
ncbi:hypothetical protein HN415_00010 [Candidatus Woesearchaeota archaeon]|jgi:hypothetical protein|nr:hypothetical protein [Candidatus Woesearchaeota archaeon]